MNINFIGKEFERLAKLEECINYEYEPKSNLKFGKRNIYFEDIKLDFINEVNTYGFSPFILESFVEQRDDPNIMRFITKKFNHGLTNYIKAQTKALTLRQNKNKKKLFINKSAKNLKINNNKKNKPKKENLISNIFLIKKNEDMKKAEEKENFLQKALGGVGGHKLNISTEEDKDKEKDKQNEKNYSLNNNKDKNKDKKNSSINEKKNIEFLKNILIGPEKKNNKVKEKLPDLKLIPGMNNFNKDDFKQGNLKSFIEKLNKLSLDNNFNYDKKVLTLSKNRNILGNQRIFSPLLKNNFKSLESKTFRKGAKLTRNKSMEPKKIKDKNKFEKIKKINKNTFLLFTKARPYRYMSYKESKIKKNNLD